MTDLPPIRIGVNYFTAVKINKGVYLIAYFNSHTSSWSTWEEINESLFRLLLIHELEQMLKGNRVNFPRHIEDKIKLIKEVLMSC